MALYSAQKWFDNFYDKFIETRKENESFGIKVTSGKYTKIMLELLEELGKEQGFDVKRERLTIDQVWKHESEGTIAVEHEITAKGILKKELPNLMDVSSDLKVLITYVYDYQFPWEPEIIMGKLETEINSRYVGRFNQFLLLIGTKTTRRFEQDKRIFVQRESDWFARSFHIGAAKKKILVPSASRKARKAWRTRKRKGE